MMRQNSSVEHIRIGDNQSRLAADFGSGIAGSYLASQLNDLDVLIIEKNRKITLKDSGIVSSDFKKFVKDRSLIQDKIKEMHFISPSGKEFSIKSIRAVQARIWAAR